MRGARNRYIAGIKRLEVTAMAVTTMSKQLHSLKPHLQQNREETEAVMREIERETRGVEKVRAQVARENRAATAKADEARAIQQECEADLAAAMPQLRAAEHAVNSLRRQDITEVRAMTSPPDGVRLVM